MSAHLTFEEWLEKLDSLAYEAGYVDLEHDSLSYQTGPECWEDSFGAGMTPAEALHEEINAN